MLNRTSFRRHFRSDPPADFFSSIVEGNGITGVGEMIKFGLSQVVAFFILCLGQLFQVCYPPKANQVKEAWQRYLSRAELTQLEAADNEVFSLVAEAALGVPPVGLREAERRLKDLRTTLHNVATRRMFESIRSAENDPARLWAFVRKFRVSSTDNSLPIDVLAHHFVSVFNRQADPVPMVFSECFEVQDEHLDSPLVLSEVESAFRALDRGMAPGASGVGNDVLIDLFRLPGGPNFFLCLFNACFLSGSLPAAWRCTEIFLLYKGKGCLSDPNSYRGIALMESALKILERILHARLSRWAFARSLIPDCQFGFRPRAGTLDAVFVLYTLLVKYVLVKRSRLFVALIDFQKAFPSVNRALLLDKLRDLGVTPRFRRSLCSMFEGNTFSLRSGNYVTREFPVTTGLREGSVLSPLLFILFISDAQDYVLRPFTRQEFLQKDPCLNSFPTPGLFYADDLALICLTADGLRERLRRLKVYADQNYLTVNVAKCEVVVFGKGSSTLKFRFNRELIPVRETCKYLGVWLDQSLSGRALAECIRQRFLGAVPVFFTLCRKLRIARLDLVFRLANALLFSLLYGAEFLVNLNVIRQCEVAWWSGVRSFYGLPSGVSAVFLHLLFPRFSLVLKASEAKFRLAYRGSRKTDTLFPEALLCDRRYLFQHHRKGYLQSLKEWAEQTGTSSVLFSDDETEIRAAHAARRLSLMEEAWDQFSSMPSTSHAAFVFGSREAVFNVVSEASRVSKLGVRALVLAMSGSLFLSYVGRRDCPDCGVRANFEHFMACPALGVPIQAMLTSCLENRDWKGSAIILLGRFEVFLHRFKGGNFTVEEADLFEALNGMAES
jgi:hypothetical protein